MKLLNIYNRNRLIYLFCRNDKGEQEIIEDNSFFPYYYELDENEGKYKSYDGKSVRKVFLSNPSDMRAHQNNKEYESDVRFTNRYLIDKVNEIEKTIIKYAFIDIEILTEEFPNPNEAKYPISCISIRSSFTKTVQSFYLGDYESEYKMIEEFINYMQKERFDLWLIWNADGFDMPYFINRISDFSKRVSPIGQERYAIRGQFYPAGISIIDYMALDKKITLNRKSSYALDARLQEVIGRGKEIKDVDFSKLSPEIKQRCENDVNDMAKMEEKLQYIPLWDGIRRLAKVQFEDFTFNSRAIDQLLLQEGKERNIVLPMKPTKEDGGEDFEGAFREIFTKGALFNRGSYDLAGAYLNVIIELCLDPANTFETEYKPSSETTETCYGFLPVNVTDRETNKIINTYYVNQNPDTLLPVIAKKLLEEKNKFKELLKNTDPNDPTFKDKEEKYKSWKSLSLSAWGVIGNKYFRYYDPRVTSMITSTIRDLLHYVIDELKKLDYEVDYIDTDGVIINDKGKNIVDLLNKLIQQWSNDRFKRSTAIHFDYEGHFEKLLLIAMCRYKGYLRREDGQLEEKTVGIEAKRKDSTVFLKRFQKELIERILNKESKDLVVTWVKEQIDKIKNLPLIEVAFPCKVGRKIEDYKNKPIFIRALEYTQEKNKDFNKKIGELFYYVYVNSDEYEEKIEKIPYVDDKKLTPAYAFEVAKKYLRNNNYKKEDLKKSKIRQLFINELESANIIEWKTIKSKSKNKNVIAFDEDTQTDIKNADYSKIIERNIHNKCKVIFEAMEWEYKLKKEV